MSHLAAASNRPRPRGAASRAPVIAFAALAALTVTAIVVWPKTYVARAVVVLEPAAGASPASLRLPDPSAISDKLRQVLDVADELEALAAQHSICRSEGAACIRAGLSVSPESKTVHVLEFRGGDATEVRDITASLAQRAVQRAPAALGGDRRAPPKQTELSSAQRQLADFVAAHPEVALSVAQTQDPKKEDSALEALRRERRKLEAEVKRVVDRLSSGTDNPYLDPVASPERLRAKLEQIDAAIHIREKETRDRPAAQASPELIATWRKLVEATRKVSAEPAAQTAAAAPLLTARLASPVALPEQPVSPNRWMLGTVGTLLSLFGSGAWSFFMKRRNATDRSSSRKRGDVSPTEKERAGKAPALPLPVAEVHPPKGGGGALLDAPNAARALGSTLTGSSAPPGPEQPAGRRASSAPPGDDSEPELLRALPARGARRHSSSPGAYSISSRAPARDASTDYLSAEVMPRDPRLPRELLNDGTDPGSKLSANAADGLGSGAPETRRGSSMIDPASPPVAPGAPAANVMVSRTATLIGGSVADVAALLREAEDAGRGQEPAASGQRIDPEIPTTVGHPPPERPSAAEPPPPEPRPSEAAQEPPPGNASRVRPVAVGRAWVPDVVLVEGTSLTRAVGEQIVYEARRRSTVVLVASSPRTSELKSRVAAQIAFGVAERQRLKVLLIEAEFERPSLGKQLHIEAPPAAGFSQQLHARVHGLAEPEWVVTQCSPTLHVLNEGRMRSPGLLWSIEFSNAIAELRSHYQVIVLDAPIACTAVDWRALDDVTDLFVLAHDERRGPPLSLEGVPLASKLLATIGG